jgi:hypothetical protein
MTNDDEDDKENQSIGNSGCDYVTIVRMEVWGIFSRMVAPNLQSFLKNHIKMLQDKTTNYFLAHPEHWYTEKQITVIRLLATLIK